MSVTRIPAPLRRLVTTRAGDRCEYCGLPAAAAFFPHEVDHIIPERHGGATEEANLAYTCWRCNRHKGTDLGSFDPATTEFAMLFHPRSQRWQKHFVFHNTQIEGLTAEGRTTVSLLQLNSLERIAERQALLASGIAIEPL